MPVVGDPTDPNGTKRPDEKPISVSTHTFKPVVVAERPSKICLPSNIRPDDPYGIFTLFFTNDVLEIFVENTNKYACRRHIELHLKAAWKETSVAELRAYLGVLIYRSLYPQPRHKDYSTIDINKPIHESLTSSISHDRFAQLEASLHISDPDVVGRNCFNKVRNMLDL